MAEHQDLAGRTVLITGASRGLGRALAAAFAGAGARLALCARSADLLTGLARKLAAAGAEVEAAGADVARKDEMAPFIRRVEDRWGAIDVLINNASILGTRTPLADFPIEEWRTVIDVNLNGVFVVTRLVLPGMLRAGRGSIVNVTSGVGNVPRARWGAYAVSKWAVEALTWNLALELRDTPIRVNAVDPGSLRTAMRHAAYPEEDPARQTEPERITPVFLWLASDDSRGVSGQRFRAQEWP